jgi:hypothetical protein
MKTRIMSSKLEKNETDKTDVGRVEGRKQKEEDRTDFEDIFVTFPRKRVEKSHAINPYNILNDLLYCAA